VIVVLNKDATQEQIAQVEDRLRALGYSIHPIYGVEKTVIGAVGAPESDKEEDAEAIRSLGCVEEVMLILRPYKFVSRESRADRSVVDVDGVKVGGDKVCIMAGPCTVETREQVLQTARAVRAAGATVLRGGAYKPSTSPYSFQGLGVEGLEILSEARAETGLKIVTEVMDPRNVEQVSRHADLLQIGTRNMQNYDLLKEVGQGIKPVLLKRGMSAKIDEWLHAAEYVYVRGNVNVILCERGIRTFEPYTRNTLDLSAVPSAKQLSHLPVIVDPSHGTGRWYLVGPMSLAALAAGADGLLIEVHPDPERAVKDGPQSLKIEKFEALMAEIRLLVTALGRSV
jgi:3-deoxy-7-phosphoheptulonate synthase